jgi:hypothetical protein
VPQVRQARESVLTSVRQEPNYFSSKPQNKVENSIVSRALRTDRDVKFLEEISSVMTVFESFQCLRK